MKWCYLKNEYTYFVYIQCIIQLHGEYPTNENRSTSLTFAQFAITLFSNQCLFLCYSIDYKGREAQHTEYRKERVDVANAILREEEYREMQMRHTVIIPSF